MGVFKWLRRERLTVTTSHISSGPSTPEEQQPPATVGTIRTDEYKRDLAEFQARRSSGHKELLETPEKKKCGRNSLPVSCTDCTGDPDTTFNYEKKSAIKYKKKTHKRTRSAHSEEKTNEGVPHIQFLFQNQVFMPGNVYGPSFSDPQKRRHSRQSARRSSEMDYLVQKQIDFNDENTRDSPPLFYKNNSLPYDVKNFLEGPRNEDDEVDGVNNSSDMKSSQSSSECKVVRSEEKLWEVMSELKQFDRWADEQLNPRSPNTSKADDSKSETSTYGLPIASSCSLNVTAQQAAWSHGKWGAVPVQIKRLPGVTIEHVKRKQCTEINILRKCRHPNIILLMGLFPDARGCANIICERCIDTLHGILHVQGRILSAQTAVHYTLDIANALVFLRMQGYLHTDLASTAIMISSQDTAKLTDLGSCAKLPRKQNKLAKEYEIYSPEPQYVNIDDSRESKQADCEPLLSQRSSEAYISANAVAKEYAIYSQSELFRWQAPELFVPEDGMVYPCSKSDVYSLALVLWECCNASLPWKTLSYDKLKDLYTLWKAGIRLPQDGTYPGCLLSLLRQGLALQRDQRPDLAAFQSSLLDVKSKLEDMEYIIIPTRLSKKNSNFTAQGWDDTTSPTDSEYQGPTLNIEHTAVVHNSRDSSTESEKDCSKSDEGPLYETIRKTYSSDTFIVGEKCLVSDEDQCDRNQVETNEIDDKNNDCFSTPLPKLPRVKDLGTPGLLHRSDSTEYCSILSPDPRSINFGFNDESGREQSSVERSAAKLSRSFTPKSYKPLHIKVPEFNLDSIKSLVKDQNNSERSSYNFDIKNYSLPTTPIARSNKLRKNAWLSGELNAKDRSFEKQKDTCSMSTSDGSNDNPKNELAETNDSHKEQCAERLSCKEFSMKKTDERSPESVDTVRDSYTGLRRVSLPHNFSSPEVDSTVCDATTWSFRSSSLGTAKPKVEEDALANVNVKPLVEIHERWISEANRKGGRGFVVPDGHRPGQGPAVKPASHCVDYLPQPQRPRAAAAKPHRARAPSPPAAHYGGLEQYWQARETFSRNTQFREERSALNTDPDKGTSTKEELKVDQSTDTRCIEEFIRDLMRKEFQLFLNDIVDDASEAASVGQKNEALFNRGVANVLESLNGADAEQTPRKEPGRTFSHITINANNKALVQIKFSRSGENSLQVLDDCVNVTIKDSSGRENASSRESLGACGRDSVGGPRDSLEGSRRDSLGGSRRDSLGSRRDSMGEFAHDRLHLSLEETLTPDDVQSNSLKRCQAFSAIQEARSTEDLYIDDDLSTQMQENFGGRVKLIPLHGSLHEILCERADDCCLQKVKQENGCDTIYFRCDTETESRDAVDSPRPDAVVFKRRISLVEERFQRVYPRPQPKTPAALRKRQEFARARPQSEIFPSNVSQETRAISNSTPSLVMRDSRGEEVEVNIENVLSYQDSSSDECLKCQVEDDDFELFEREIERDVSGLGSLVCGCLEKISEENLSALNEEGLDRN